MKEMHTMRTLAGTDLKVAPLCLGGNPFGWTAGEAASQAVLDAYMDLGGNFVDTADVYSNWVSGHEGGESEAILGRWMKARGNRDKVVLVTKVGSRMGPGPEDQGLSRSHITRAVEDSLRRLQTDYIDLYLAHRDDPNTPLKEALEGFTGLVQGGKVRYIGASNYSAKRLAAALQQSDRHGYAPFVCLQPRYNLVAREDYEGPLEELCVEQGLVVITYSALAGGFLSGKYRRGEPLPRTARAANVESRYMNDQGFAVLAEVDRVAKAHGATASQVALAWQMARPSITAPIASATSPEQVRELMGAINLRLSREEIAALDAAGRG
jgi:aryl-alcohol dehydrogenase-like predicted oxidoreductase